MNFALSASPKSLVCELLLGVDAPASGHSVRVGDLGSIAIVENW
jgi:hypothetical protein